MMQPIVNFLDSAVATPSRRFLWWVGIVLGFLLLCCLCASDATATTLTGTVKVNGTPFNGTMTFQLNYPATSGTYLTMPQQTAPIPIQGGTFASLVLDGNDTLLPRGTYYAFRFYDPYGQLITRLNYVVTGSTYDLGSAIPTPIQTNNVNFLDLLGIRNFSAMNATFTNSVCIGPGACINQGGISNAENIMDILFATAYNQQNPSSTTCGVQEAETALPSTGGTIVLQSGTCNLSSAITLSKPTALVGFGSGGPGNTALTSMVSPTVLNQSTAGQPAIIVAPVSGQTLSGMYIHGLGITGTAAADGIDLGLLADTTGFLRNVVIDDVVVHHMGASGVGVVGNLYGLTISNSTLTLNTNSGLAIPSTLISTYAVDAIHLGPNLRVSSNGTSGVALNAPALSHVYLDHAKLVSNTGSGLTAASTATSLSVLASDSDFSSNTSAGANLAGGSGHVFGTSSFVAAGIQQYGINITSTGLAGSQTLSLKDNTFSSNTIADVNVGASVPYVLVYPEITQATTTYTVSAWSIASGTATLTVAGNNTITTGSGFTLSGATGQFGCLDFNGPHSALSANTTTITFTTLCSGTGSTGSVAGGTMTIAQATPGNVHYISPTTSTVGIQYLILGSATITSCALASDSDGHWSCQSTFPWPTALSVSTYNLYCTLQNPATGYDVSRAAVTTFMWLTKSTTGFTYQLANEQSGSNGAAFNMNCIATQ